MENVSNVSSNEVFLERNTQAVAISKPVVPQMLLLPQDTYPTRILRLPEVMERVGLKHSSIYHYISRGTFPRQIALGDQAVGWLEHEINAWLALRMRTREHPA